MTRWIRIRSTCGTIPYHKVAAMEQMLSTLNAGLPALGLELPPETAQTLCAFGEAVIRQNEVMNLTATFDLYKSLRFFV